MRQDTARQPLSVLLIEEDPSVARLVMSALSMEGYLVVGCVASVREAKRVVDEEGPDFIVLGHQMIPLGEFDFAGSRLDSKTEGDRLPDTDPVQPDL